MSLYSVYVYTANTSYTEIRRSVFITNSDNLPNSNRLRTYVAGQSTISIYKSRPKLLEYMVESNNAVVGIIGVVSVLSGSFLGSIPSMDMTCVWCQPNVKSRRLFVKGPIGFARDASETRSRHVRCGSRTSQRIAAKHLPSLHAVMIQSS